MLCLGVIEESDCPKNNTITLVRKPRKNRLCLDSRKLNQRTVRDAYPQQNIEGILRRINTTKFISSVDLKHALWQIEMEESSRRHTAFTVPGRPMYHFVVVSFGLTNAAQLVCRLMDKVIPQKLREKVFLYLDDLLIVSPRFEEHLDPLREVSQCQKKAGLTIGLKKSHFRFKELRYLGFVIGGGIRKTDPGKVEAIKNMPIPRRPTRLVDSQDSQLVSQVQNFWQPH